MKKFIFPLFLIFFLVACNSEDVVKDTKKEVEEVKQEAVTLLMMTHWEDEVFKRNFKEPIEAQYENITLEHVQARSSEIEELFAKKVFPDIIMTSELEFYNEMEFLMDLNPLIEQSGFDLNTLEPNILEYLKSISKEGEVNGLPFVRPEYALVYNPDVFDLFGVDYPTDGMTWEEVIALAPQVTGEANGKMYLGLHPGEYDFMLWQVPGSRLIDPVTHKPNIKGNEAFEMYLKSLQEIYAIPGSQPNFDDFKTTEEVFTYRPVKFMQRGNVAMVVDRGFPRSYAGSDINFDFVTYPVWGGEHGEYAPNEPGNGFVVTTKTEHPKEAFQVVSHFLSEDYQKWQSAVEGNVTALVSEDVREAFFTEHEAYEVLQEKNLQAMFKLEPAPIKGISPYESEILEGIDFKKALFEGEDVNTIIREMQEQAEANYKDVISRK